MSKDDYYGTGGDSAAELIPADCSGKTRLSNDTNEPYFWVDDSDERMYFQVNLGDSGATTINSSYVRSELRELYHYQTQDPCSSSNQNWAINQQHQLSSSLRIEQYPQINGQDPKVIVGQIHAYQIKQALVKLQWDGPNKPIRAILNDSFAPNNDSCDSCQSFSVELGTVDAGTQWHYDIVANQQGLTITTEINNTTTARTLAWGEPVLAKDGKYYSLTEAWLEETYYFKAGIYPQIQPDEDYQNQIFEVSFDKITIQHQ